MDDDANLQVINQIPILSKHIVGNIDRYNDLFLIQSILIPQNCTEDS